MKDLFDLTGKNAIVTGGAGSLGTQHARALLQKNCNVELWDVDIESLKHAYLQLSNEFPTGIIATKLVDITSEEAISSALLVYKEELLAIHILINNAALNPKYQNNSEDLNSQFENYSLETWNLEILVGLTGAMLCSKHIGTYMASLGGGVILNISSDLSVISPDQRIYRRPELDDLDQFKKPVSYSVIKSGIVGLTRYLSTYWSEKGVRANSLSPGGVYENQEPLFVQNLISRIPMARMANIDEYVGAIQFLCSDSSSYLNGQNIVIDGGRSIW
jgi:NAD(P)-dependent dehydrogenase (short-subunit alcohol dehydrogenase family)